MEKNHKSEQRNLVIAKIFLHLLLLYSALCLVHVIFFFIFFSIVVVGSFGLSSHVYERWKDAMRKKSKEKENKAQDDTIINFFIATFCDEKLNYC
jgi:ABC-type phosphate transport system permease subunit